MWQLRLKLWRSKVKINIFDIWEIEIDWRAVAAIALAIAIVAILG